jgi:hypothetical protein
MRLEKKDFGLYPLKLKGLDSALGPKRRKTREFRQKLQTTSHLQSPSYFMGSFTLHSYAARIIAFSLLSFRDNTSVE